MQQEDENVITIKIKKPKKISKPTPRKQQLKSNDQIAEIANTLLTMKNELKKIANNQQQFEKNLQVSQTVM